MSKRIRTNHHTVAVLAPDGTPLNPTHPAKARILLKRGRAKVERRYPIFTIRLTYWPEHLEVQPTQLRLDDGETMGFAVVQRNPTGERVVCAGEVITTGREVSDRLSDRGRLRQTRKRLARRKRGERGSPKPEKERGEGWYPPSIRLDVHQKVRVVRLLCRLFPIQEIIVETVSVDIRKLLEPEVSGQGYQEPRTIRARLRWAFPEECAVCGTKLTRGNSVTHHLTKRSRGGARNFTNEIPLCRKCHRTAGDSELCLDGREYRDTRAFGRLQHGRRLLLSALSELAPVRETKGVATARARQALGLSKTHIHDAIACGADPNRPLPVTLPAVVWEVHNPTRRTRKLFDENFGVAKYRREAERQPGVDRERMRVDDHDHEHNVRNRSYRRHVRNRYYRRLRREGRFNWELVGPSGKEIYSPNAAIHLLRDGRVVVQKRRLFGQPRPKGVVRTLRRNYVVQTSEGWLGKVWALMSNGTVKILFAENHGRKHPFTQRVPGRLALVSRRMCWLPKRREERDERRGRAHSSPR